MDEKESRLQAARAQQDPKALADYANWLLEKGEPYAAREALDEAIALSREQGRPQEEARGLHLAATLHRLTGNLAGAKERARRAESLVEPGTPVAVSAATELGEIALAQQQARAATEAYSRALDGGRAVGMVPAAQAALLRRRARAHMLENQIDAAVEDLEEAHDLYESAGAPVEAVQCLVEAATALQQGSDQGRALQMQQRAREEAIREEQHGALAQLYILDASRAINARDTAAAMVAAKKARAEALQAVDATSYITAAITISELAEATGDYVAAYEALAVGWVTLADLLGREVAKATFEPKLQAQRERWGAERFAQAKAAYEAQRLGGGS